MAQHVLEGTWEEITLHATELSGRRVRLTVLAPEQSPEAAQADENNGNDDNDTDALAQAVVRMTNRTPEQIAEAQARAAAIIEPGRLLPPGTTIFDAVAGKWPGEEMDEEVTEALNRLS